VKVPAARLLRGRLGQWLLKGGALFTIEAVAPATLLADPHAWLFDCLGDKTSLKAIPPERVEKALLGRLSWDERQRLEQVAPARFGSPAGTAHPIDYAAPAGPTVEVRVQALFGLDVHPTVGQPPGRCCSA